jgi:hypothetical protein
MNQQAPPTKLFREEGKTGAIKCPACGAPISLRSFGAVEQVACSFCGTVCKPEEDGNLEVLDHATRQRRPSILPLHKRGEIEGVTWEIIGITWRQVEADGVAYPWQEFLLFNPYQGYRWLIYAMTDGVWSFGGALPGAAEIKPGMRPTASYAGETYKHFTRGNAQTIYVEGEFPWQVFAGDVAQTNDYICPPKLISIEVQHTDHGADLNFTQMRPIAASEVWQAFAMPGGPPPTPGVHPAAINPFRTRFYWLATPLLILVWIVAMIAYLGGLEERVVFRQALQHGEIISQELKLGEPGEQRPVEFSLRASGMTNSWAAAEVLLVDESNDNALAVALDVDAWSGVSDGESWSEGSNPRTQIVGAVEGGTYFLQVSAQIEQTSRPDSSSASSLELTITRDVPLARYMFLPLLFIVLFPALNLARRTTFETKRWSTSDYAATSDD